MSLMKLKKQPVVKLVRKNNIKLTKVLTFHKKFVYLLVELWF